MVNRLLVALVLVLGLCHGSLGRAQEKVPEELLRDVKDAEPATRAKAIMALSQLGVEALPVLLEALNDADSDVGGTAEQALRIIKLAPAEYMKALQPFLADKRK